MELVPRVKLYCLMSPTVACAVWGSCELPPLSKSNTLTQNTKHQMRTARNRAGLIEATLDCIAEIGLARTSVTEIVNRAGLSRGMIHLHFGGKDNLLVAAAEFAGASYYENLDQLLQSTGPGPQQQLEALILSDLDEKVLNRRSVNIWYALRGEAREHRAVAQYSDTRDNRLRTLAFDAFEQIARAEKITDPDIVARDLTHGTLALLEGMWTDFLLHPDSFSRQTACRIIFRFLAALLPDHFDLDGAHV